jgi:hypothetical protein
MQRRLLQLLQEAQEIINRTQKQVQDLNMCDFKIRDRLKLASTCCGGRGVSKIGASNSNMSGDSEALQRWAQQLKPVSEQEASTQAPQPDTRIRIKLSTKAGNACSQSEEVRH